jgi:hypothetical protein
MIDTINSMKNVPFGKRKMPAIVVMLLAPVCSGGWTGCLD